MDNLKDNEQVEFLWRRLSEDCPPWAIGVPVLFAFIVLGLIVMFRQDKKAWTGLIGSIILGVIALVVYLPLAYILRPFFSWLVVLLPIMAVALFYVVLMYIRDSRSVHPLWAIFLGMLRTCVYLVLAVVFLLPGCQHSDKLAYESKVLFLFDVSGSMDHRDDPPEAGKDPATLPTRQDKILNFLTEKKVVDGQEASSFIERVVQKSPVIAYRFGQGLDEIDVQKLRNGKLPAQTEWKQWLNPNPKDLVEPKLADIKIAQEDKRKKEFGKQFDLFSKRVELAKQLKKGTNIGNACLQAHKLESNTLLQAIVVISDGQNNTGSDDARTQFLARVNNSKAHIPVFTVGVGHFRQPVEIRIEDLLAPEETRPDNKFPVRVPVVGPGLLNQEFTTKLEVTRITDADGKPVKEKTYILPEQKKLFKGAGDFPQEVVEFEIDVQELKNIKAKDDKNRDLEGEWQFIARVPRNPKETFPLKEHVAEPVKVLVQKRPLRVLLFAGGATREYQFLRTALYREVADKRMEMSIYLQTGREAHIDQNVESDRLLADFPDRHDKNEGGPKYMSLDDYDVVVAFDPDWSRLTPKQLTALNEWVITKSGGVIFVAGPMFTYQVARKGGREIDPLLEIFPVELQDNRLHGLGGTAAGLGHDATRPYALNFHTPSQFSYLKLDDNIEDSPIAGWKGFFWDNENFQVEPGKEYEPKRGFFTYYPVKELKPASRLVATFMGPKESRINNGKDEQPFIVELPVGKGKTLYIGSGELWRMRKYKDGYFEGLWLKMMRHVAPNETQQKKYGRILMPRTAPVGLINIEAQVKGKDLQPLSSKLTPTVLIWRLEKNQAERTSVGKFDLRPKPGQASKQGFFIGSTVMKDAGTYEFELPIPNSKGIPPLKQTVVIREPNPEKDNVRTNFGYLYQLSSEAGPALGGLPPETRKKIEALLLPPQDQTITVVGGKRLHFPLESADAIAECLVPMPPRTETVKGRLQDFLDEGAKTDRYVDVYWAALLAPVVVGVVGALILCLLQQWLNAVIFFGICVVASLGMGVFNYIFSNLMAGELPVNFSYLLMIVVSFLGIEWLARKLLRLA